MEEEEEPTLAEFKQQDGGRATIHPGNEPFRITAIPPQFEIDYDKEVDLAKDKGLWELIKGKTINFKAYQEFITSVMCPEKPEKGKPGTTISNGKSREEKMILSNQIPFHSSQAYSILKYATEQFVKTISDSGNPANELMLSNSPYLELIKSKLEAATMHACPTGVWKGLELPVMSELIWSYWHEEGYLVQTMNAISRRFQNIQIGIGNVLNHLDIDPLRPLSNILWGYIQDTQHRLTIPRRAYEYENHYGINLIGKAVKNIQPVNSRSGFMGAFNNLLNRCAHFYRERDNAIRRADGFPVLNALKEVHLILAEGAHNQFGDLPTVAKIEMLIEQWILARPEVREFLGGKIMVPYSEPWMEKVDCMKNLQGWDKTSINYYHDLAVFGEQLILSIRYINWNSINQANFAAGWADFWRNEIQGYIHRYQVVTGVDLSADAPDYAKKDYHIPPAILIKRRLSR